VAVGKTIEALERPAAAKRKADAGKHAGRGRPKRKAVDDLSTANASSREPGRTTGKAARTVGMSHIPYERAKAVVEAAEEDPETFHGCG
jgi:hypothetical protein